MKKILGLVLAISVFTQAAPPVDNHIEVLHWKNQNDESNEMSLTLESTPESFVLGLPENNEEYRRFSKQLEKQVGAVLQSKFGFTGTESGIYEKNFADFGFNVSDDNTGTIKVIVINPVASHKSDASLANVAVINPSGIEIDCFPLYLLRIKEAFIKNASSEELEFLIGHELGHIIHSPHFYRDFRKAKSSDRRRGEKECDLYAVRTLGKIEGGVSYFEKRLNSVDKEYLSLLTIAGLGACLKSFELAAPPMFIIAAHEYGKPVTHPTDNERIAYLEDYAKEREWDYSCVTRARKERRKRQLKWMLAGAAAVGVAWIGS